ncbi:hypothetical protein D9611_000315 [Ephemerocybe angulata]|uniref:DUF6533 domain-containing protein n=1 Tax=Ephemerocybe angulata TaxID=980116 RepID=A0A8H5F6T3_9AGAR|nr:hypothetical protein D9611_000315 [Tulosesus angulatus]
MDSMASASPSSQAAAAKALLDIYRAALHTSYIASGGFALVVVDYIQTFPEEVELMWFAPLSIPKVLFFVVRYYVIVDNIFVVLWRGYSASECKVAFTRSAISSPLLVVGAEAILFYRVYAFSGRGRWMLIYLLLQFITIHVISFIFLARFLGSLEFIDWPLPKALCVPFKADLTLLAGVYIALLASVIIAVLIMMFVAYRKHRGLNSTLLQVFYRDGVFYFICLSALASANIAMSFAAPNGYKYLFAEIEIDAHAILATRMLLHLRNIANRERQSTIGSGPPGFQGRIPVRANPRSPMHFEGVPRYPPRRDSLREPMNTTDINIWFDE